MNPTKQAKGTTGIHGQIDSKLADDFEKWIEKNGMKKTAALELAIANLIGKKPPKPRTAGRPKNDPRSLNCREK